MSIPEVSSRSRLIAFLQGALKKLNSLTIGNYTFPTSDGTEDQVLTTDGAGTLTFENAGGGGGGISWDGSTANGVATFKDANEATVESNLTFDGSTLTVTGDAQVTNLNVATDIIHVGDTDTKIGFTSNTQIYTCANSERLKLNSTGVGLMGATPIAGLAVTGDIETSGDVDIASGQYLRTNGIAAVGSSGNEVQFGSAATSKTLALRTDVGTALSIDAAGVVTFDVAPATGTDNTVLIINSSNEIIRDEIDSKVWAGDLVDYTGTPVNNQLAIWTDTDTLEGDSGLTFDGNTLTIAEPTSGDTLVLGRASGEASIKAASSEHMIIDSTGQYLSLNHYENDDVVLGYGGGHVSIGTNNSPDYLLEVSSETAYEGVATVTQYNNSNAVDGSNLYLRRARGTMASPTIVQEDDNIGGIRWYSYNGSAWDLSGEIKVECDATPAADDTPGRIVFSTTPDNDDSLTERMRIDSAGLVGIGTTAPQVELHVCDSNGAPQIRLSDTDASIDQQVVAYLEYYRGSNTNRIGWSGYGSSTTQDLTVTNQTATGSFEVKTNNTTAFTVDYQGNADVVGDLTVTGGDITLGDSGSPATTYIRDSGGDARISFANAGGVILRDLSGGAEFSVNNGFAYVYGYLQVVGDIKNSAGLTTTTMNSDGSITNPLQPMVYAYRNATQDLSPDTSWETVIFNDESTLNATAFDVGSDFNTGTGVFTAPADGKYLISTEVMLTNVPASAAYVLLNLITTKATADGISQYAGRVNPGSWDAEMDYYQIAGTWLANMSSGDTAYVQVRNTGADGDTKIYGATTTTYTRIQIMKVA